VSAPSVIYASAGVYTISLVSANASGSGNTAIKTITVNTCTGLSEKQHATGDIKFFPNPVKDKLRLQSVGEKPVMYQLYNSLGQLLYSGTLPGGLSVNISMEHLPKGIYLLNTTNAHGKEVHKIIKD
jgi:PKD repeat protein